MNNKRNTKKTLVVSGADIIDAVHSNNKNIDCPADYKICKYFSSGECNHRTLLDIDEIVICPYYLMNKKD